MCIVSVVIFNFLFKGRNKGVSNCFTLILNSWKLQLLIPQKFPAMKKSLPLFSDSHLTNNSNCI
jgi:hypothetical protein